MRMILIFLIQLILTTTIHCQTSCTIPSPPIIINCGNFSTSFTPRGLPIVRNNPSNNIVNLDGIHRTPTDHVNYSIVIPTDTQQTIAQRKTKVKSKRSRRCGTTSPNRPRGDVKYYEDKTEVPKIIFGISLGALYFILNKD